LSSIERQILRDKIVLNKRELALKLENIKVASKRNIFQGLLIGNIISLDLISRYKDDKLSNKQKNELSTLENKYTAENDRMSKKLEINEFAYDYVSQKVILTISYLKGEIDIDTIMNKI